MIFTTLTAPFAAASPSGFYASKNGPNIVSRSRPHVMGYIKTFWGHFASARPDPPDILGTYWGHLAGDPPGSAPQTFSGHLEGLRGILVF